MTIINSILDIFEPMQFSKDDLGNNIIVGCFWILIVIALVMIIFTIIQLIIVIIKQLYHLTLTYQVQKFNLTVTNRNRASDDVTLLPIDSGTGTPIFVPFSSPKSGNTILYSPDLHQSFTLSDPSFYDNHQVGDVISCQIAIGKNKHNQIKHMYVKSYN